MKQTIAIIGGGAAALSLAAFLDTNKFDVSIYEKNKSFGRKFLVAGKGGFNLTHSEEMEAFVKRYTPESFLANALSEFSNTDFIDWLAKIGIPTFVGSSKRIFPEKGIKPIEVLNKIMAVLKTKKVNCHYEHTWIGWDENNALLFKDGQKVKADFCVFAMGGGSWKVTGSDGSWMDTFQEKGISTVPFAAANCAYEVNWPNNFIAINEGRPLKNIAISCGEKTHKGEVVITRFGLEGNAIYHLSPYIQKPLHQHHEAGVFIDLKPSLTKKEITNRLVENKADKKITDILRKIIKLDKTQVNLLKAHLTKAQFLDPLEVADKIKQLP